MTQPFGGHFDGRGHTVTYSVKAGEKEHGLFPNLTGTAEAVAEVRDLKVVVEEYSPKKDAAGGALVCRAEKSVISGVSVTLNKYTPPTGGESAGGSALVGTVSADAVIENCYVKAAAGDYRAFGGVAYENAGRIENCEFVLIEGVSALGNFGGIVCLNAGVISNSRASVPTGTALAADAEAFGGIAATLSGGSVSGCDAQISLSAGGDVCAAGGIAGRVTGAAKVENSRSSGALITGKYAGGIVGVIEATAAQAEVTGCTGAVAEVRAPIADAAAGGLIGLVNVGGSVTVTGCTSVADISASTRGGGLAGCVDFAGSGALSFTMTGCVSTAASVNVTGDFAGGAIGFVIDRNVPGNTAAVSVADCEAYAACVAANYAGGFVGDHNTNELPVASRDMEYANCAAHGSASALGNAGGLFGGVYGGGVRILRCRASGAAEVQSIHGGGLVGNTSGNADGKIVIANSTAVGTVTGLGGIGGFVGRADYTNFSGCYARGDVRVPGDGWEDGGFIGKAVHVTAEDCVAEGKVDMLVVSNVKRYHVGGFMGSHVGNGTFRNCVAYGDVEGNTYFGGFIGNILREDVFYTVSFTNCKAYGDTRTLTGAPGIANYCGGFVGISTERGTVSFTDCEAYGEARGANPGGFASRVDTGTLTFTNCRAYGEVENLYNDDLTAGGFVGWVASVESLTMSNCASYGKVSTFTTVSNNSGPETGGLVGHISGSKSAAISGCHSYAPQIVGPARGDTQPTMATGALIGTVHSTDARVNNCTYTQGNVYPMIGNVYAGATQTGAGNTPEAAVPPNPKPALVCTASQPAGTDLRIAFTTVSGISGSVRELGVSLDAGRSFTLLVYQGVPLTGALGGNGVPAAPFAFTLKHTGHTGIGGVVVRIAFTDGYARTFTF